MIVDRLKTEVVLKAENKHGQTGIFRIHSNSFFGEDLVIFHCFLT